MSDQNKKKSGSECSDDEFAPLTMSNSNKGRKPVDLGKKPIKEDTGWAFVEKDDLDMKDNKTCGM
jgi:hypothetical protein